MPLSGHIVITGGSGTLGHAVLLKAQRERWDAEFTIFSRSELRQAKMRDVFPGVKYLLGDVRDRRRVFEVIQQTQPDVIIHAAAMKRIPECEESPGECFATNVDGARHILEAATAVKTSTVIGISTDKACRAITTYGASKLCMEGLFRQTPYSLVRYGNVIASNGSVLPIWKDHWRQNRPVPMTDPLMTRFWMSPFDAVELLVEAASRPGQTVVPKMKALSLGQLLQSLYPGASISIIGRRSYEKRHEDLVHLDEPAVEELRRIYLNRSLKASLGIEYSSFTAPTLSRDDLNRMLGDALELEAVMK